MKISYFKSIYNNKKEKEGRGWKIKKKSNEEGGGGEKNFKFFLKKKKRAING